MRFCLRPPCRVLRQGPVNRPEFHRDSGRFGCIEDARTFSETFFTYYNHEHRHSGIGLHPPASVHYGTHVEIREQRRTTLFAAFEANPIRFRRLAPSAPSIPQLGGSTHRNWRWLDRSRLHYVSHSI